MKTIGLFYGKGGEHTKLIADEIIKEFGDVEINVIYVEDATQEDFERYDNIIAGVSTWFDGELPIYWDETVPEVEASNLEGKKVAIFGLGDQLGYPDNFVDGVGILARVFRSAGAELVGLTLADGYEFGNSLALEDDQFLGLIIDDQNQPDLTQERIKDWVEQLYGEFL